jgi:hypothetical protein
MKKITISLLSIVWLLIATSVGLACSCNLSHLVGKSEKSQVKYAREHSDVVFSGVVTDIIVDEKAHMYEAKFKVREAWKGIKSETVSLFGGTDCCFCQYEFKVGESYLLYASVWSTDKDKLGTNICTRTQPVSEAAKDLKYLGKSKSNSLSSPISIMAKPNKALQLTAR